MAVRALKSTPLLFGINESTTETHANRQWEIQVAGVKSIQHVVEFVMERLCGLGLRARGLAATVRFRFAELRAAQAMRDAQAVSLRINNAARERDEGWIRQVQASAKSTGRPAAFAKPVRAAVTGAVPPPLGRSRSRAPAAKQAFSECAPRTFRGA